MGEERNHFKYRLADIILESGKPRKQVAAELGMTYATMNNYFHGTIPKIETLNKIALYFNTTVDYLVGRTNEKQAEINERS